MKVDIPYPTQRQAHV